MTWKRNSWKEVWFIILLLLGMLIYAGMVYDDSVVSGNQTRDQVTQVDGDSHNERGKEADYSPLIWPGLVVLGLTSLAIFKATHADALVITDEEVKLRPTALSSMSRISLDQLGQVAFLIRRYKIKDDYREDAIVYFKDRNGLTLDSITISGIDLLDFNDIQREVSKRAPHVVFTFPRKETDKWTFQ